MWYLYHPQVAVDAAGNVVHDGVGLLFDKDNGTTPLPMRDVNGLPISQVGSTSAGLIQAFQVEAPVALWKSGTFEVPVASWEGMEAAALAAQTAAQNAATAATNAVAAATKFQVIPHGGSTSGFDPGTIIIELPA